MSTILGTFYYKIKLLVTLVEFVLTPNPNPNPNPQSNPNPESNPEPNPEPNPNP